MLHVTMGGSDLLQQHHEKVSLLELDLLEMRGRPPPLANHWLPRRYSTWVRSLGHTFFEDFLGVREGER
jgi:hypothetical protein